MRHYIIIILILSVVISGCSDMQSDEDTLGTKIYSEIESVDVSLINDRKIDYTDSFDQSYNLYISAKDYTLEMFEPQLGCYIGANIMNDKIVSSDIEKFEEATLKEHLLYANEIKLGQEYPYSWILECISKEKTPVLTIIPDEQYSPFQIGLLEKTAKEVGELNIPMFIQFYPYSSDRKYDAKDYISYFKQAYFVFEKYAPNVALVWSVSSNEVYDCLSYYPGDSYVDWVGINITQNIQNTENSNEEEKLYRPVLNDIDYFYYTFQKQKPIMISNFSVSHFSTKDMQYYTNEAASQVNKIYKSISDKYPRIKGIIYNSYSQIDSLVSNPDDEILNNYLIEEEDFILGAYKEGINNVAFTSDFSSLENIKAKYEYIRSPFSVYSKDDNYFISEKSLEYDLDLFGLSLLNGKEVYIDGSKYYNIEQLKNVVSFDYEVDDLMQEVIWDRR